MKSLPPKEYASLPALEAPAGYIIVIRDIDRDTFRIDGTRSPGSYVEKLQRESQRRFGIELVSILQTPDLSASEAELYDRHHASLSEQWLALDPYQVEELRRSSLQIDAQESLYLSPKQEAASERSAFDQTAPRSDRPATRYVSSAGGNYHRSTEAMEFRRAYAPRPPRSRSPGYRRYADSLRLYREEQAAARRADPDDPIGWLMHFSRRSDEFFKTCLGKVVKFVLALLLGIILYALGFDI